MNRRYFLRLAAAAGASSALPVKAIQALLPLEAPLKDPIVGAVWTVQHKFETGVAGSIKLIRDPLCPPGKMYFFTRKDLYESMAKFFETYPESTIDTIVAGAARQVTQTEAEAFYTL